MIASIQIGVMIESRTTPTTTPIASPALLMLAGADRRQPLQQVVAQRQRLAADDQPDHDQDEGHRGADAGLFDVARHLGLGDADDQAGDQRDREGAEAGDQRRRGGGEDEVGEDRRLQGDDRDDQDRGEAGEAAAEAPS